MNGTDGHVEMLPSPGQPYLASVPRGTGADAGQTPQLTHAPGKHPGRDRTVTNLTRDLNGDYADFADMLLGSESGEATTGRFLE